MNNFDLIAKIFNLQYIESDFKGKVLYFLIYSGSIIILELFFILNYHFNKNGFQFTTAKK